MKVFDSLTMAERNQAVEACKIIKTVGRASVSCLQRRMKIGYTQAAHIMDLLEEAGVVGIPSDVDYQRPIYEMMLDEALNTPKGA